MKIELRDIGNGVVLTHDFGVYDCADTYFRSRRKAVEAAKRRLDSWLRGEHD